jgi:hypothetical protein
VQSEGSIMKNPHHFSVAIFLSASGLSERADMDTKIKINLWEM